MKSFYQISPSPLTFQFPSPTSLSIFSPLPEPYIFLVSDNTTVKLTKIELLNYIFDPSVNYQIWTDCKPFHVSFSEILDSRFVPYSIEVKDNFFIPSDDIIVEEIETDIEIIENMKFNYRKDEKMRFTLYKGEEYKMGRMRVRGWLKNERVECVENILKEIDELRKKRNNVNEISKNKKEKINAKIKISKDKKIEINKNKEKQKNIIEIKTKRKNKKKETENKKTKNLSNINEEKINVNKNKKNDHIKKDVEERYFDSKKKIKKTVKENNKNNVNKNGKQNNDLKKKDDKINSKKSNATNEDFVVNNKINDRGILSRNSSINVTNIENSIDSNLSHKLSKIPKRGIKRDKIEIKRQKKVSFLPGTDLSFKFKTITKQKGTGRKINAGDTVKIKYSAMLENGQIFDGTRKVPYKFVLGKGQVIEGLEKGMKGISVGEKRKIMIPSKLGYGEVGNEKVPANSNLIFDVEVVG